MTELSTPARYIRERVFRLSTQDEFGNLIGYTQGTISKFETGAERLSAEAQERIRAAAKRLGIKFDNNWFFEVPAEKPRRHTKPVRPASAGRATA